MPDNDDSVVAAAAASPFFFMVALVDIKPGKRCSRGGIPRDVAALSTFQSLQTGDDGGTKAAWPVRPTSAKLPYSVVVVVVVVKGKDVVVVTDADAVLLASTDMFFCTSVPKILQHFSVSCKSIIGITMRTHVLKREFPLVNSFPLALETMEFGVYVMWS
jgi:hypothetical protein